MIIATAAQRGAEEFAKGLDEETASKIADYMNLEGSRIEALAPKFDYTVDISQEDIDSLNDTIAFLYKVKQIPSIFDISDHIWKQ